MQIIFLALAIVFLCFGHICKTIRWRMFVEIYEKPQEDSLMLALASGYLVNFFLPYKLGDILRAYVSGKKMKNGFSFSIATIIVDRYLDIIAVGFIFLLFILFGNDGLVGNAFFYLGLSVVVLILTVAAFFLSGYVKKIVRILASVFNDKIEFFILKIMWSLIWNFKDIFQKIKKIKLLLSTVIMWVIYLVSYYFFGLFLSESENRTSLTDVFSMLFSQSGLSARTSGVSDSALGLALDRKLYLFIYMVVPLLLILGGVYFYKIFLKKNTIAPEKSEKTYLNLLPHIENKDRLKFLDSYFSNDNREYIKNYLLVNQNISILQDYSAGSNATTMLCLDEDHTFFRKYAFEKDSLKLYEQIQWIQSFQNDIPLPRILNFNKGTEFCFYDMEYRANAVSLFKYIHSKPTEESWKIIYQVLECLEEQLYKKTLVNNVPHKKEMIHNYIENKIEKNLEIIKKAKKIRPLLEYEYLFINGKKIPNLKYFMTYLKPERLQNMFMKDDITSIHGDLTIENIICTYEESGRDDFYIIDPNTGNIWDSPFLDYGKLLQSLHGGYEFLMTTPSVEVAGNSITFISTRSSVYSNLFEQYNLYLEKNFTTEQIKNIYYHEIIHWIRLMPYKIEKDNNRSILFFAGMLLVMSDVEQRFERKQEE